MFTAFSKNTKILGWLYLPGLEGGINKVAKSQSETMEWTPGWGGVTNLGEVSVPFGTLQRAGFQNLMLWHTFSENWSMKKN